MEEERETVRTNALSLSSVPKFLACCPSSRLAFQQHIRIHTLHTQKKEKRKKINSLKPISFNFKKAFMDPDIGDCASKVNNTRKIKRSQHTSTHKIVCLTH